MSTEELLTISNQPTMKIKVRQIFEFENNLYVSDNFGRLWFRTEGAWHLVDLPDEPAREKETTIDDVAQSVNQALWKYSSKLLK